MDMAKLLQMLMAGGGNSDDNNDSASGDSAAQPSSDSNDFSDFFSNIDFDMVFKMGELFSQLNKPDKNSELLNALKPHLRDENHHKIDTALKLSKMITLMPVLKESGILNNLF